MNKFKMGDIVIVKELKGTANNINPYTRFIGKKCVVTEISKFLSEEYCVECYCEELQTESMFRYDELIPFTNVIKTKVIGKQ